MLKANTWPCLPPKRPRRPSGRLHPKSPATTHMTIHSPLRTAGLGNQTTWMISRRRKRRSRCESEALRPVVRQDTEGARLYVHSLDSRVLLDAPVEPPLPFVNLKN